MVAFAVGIVLGFDLLGLRSEVALGERGVQHKHGGALRDDLVAVGAEATGSVLWRLAGGMWVGGEGGVSLIEPISNWKPLNRFEPDSEPTPSRFRTDAHRVPDRSPTHRGRVPALP